MTVRRLRTPSPLSCAPCYSTCCIHNTDYTLIAPVRVDTYLALLFAMRSGDLALGMQCVARMSLVAEIASFLSSTTVWLYSKSNLCLNHSPSNHRVRQSRCTPL